MKSSQLKAFIGTIKRKPSEAPLNGEASPDKTTVLHDLTHLGVKNTKTVAQAISTLASGQPLNDKDELLENGVEMLQSLPLNSTLSQMVSNDFIAMLWNDLPHPPSTLSGPSARYRQHDGSGNNPWVPNMGKAGSPYSRTVPPMKPKGPNLPDPELVFEYLLKRNGPFREHPSGLNRLFFSFATIVIHECFQTSRSNPWINETSSYVDLSTLYGNTEKEQVRVRTYENGKIFPDSIASERIMMMPPGVIAVLLLFSRNHNHIAESLLSINEDGNFREWNTLSDEEKVKQDDEIFQLARNINVGYFASVVLKDYVAAILNTPRANSTWSLDLGAEIKKGANRAERATGNVVSIEFVVLYHWHAALSAADDKWMESLFRDQFPDLGSVDEITVEMFMKVMKIHAHKLLSTPAKEWTFGGLKRGPNGKFSDYELSELIKDCIEEPAHAFGAHGTPASLKVVDILGQLQARDIFNVCTMNEFRRYLNLVPYKDFKDWCGDKETARAAELLYGHIDNLELYPGLMAEVTKPPRAGSGVCPGQTTGRGILGDAVALVRGDRFLSYDFNSSTLTNWGVSKLQSLPGGAYGGMFPDLLMKGLPGAFPGTSIYSLLSFYTPTAAKDILKGNKVTNEYSLERPASGLELVGIHTQEGVLRAFEDREIFRVMYMKAIKECTGGFEFLLGWDDVARHDPRSQLLYKIYFDEGFETKLSKFFTETVANLIKEKSLKYSGSKRSIDIVRDVTNVAPILWLAQRFAIPLKTSKTPHGVLTVGELFKVYLVLFIYQSFNIIPSAEWKLREGARKAGSVLRSVHTAHLKTQQGIKEGIVDWLAKDSAYEVGPEADRLYHALNSTKLPIGDLVASSMLLAAPVAGNITQQASLLIDLYLSPGYEKYKERIIELAHLETSAAERELQGFVYEGMRHAGVVPGVPRVVSKDVTFIDGARGPLELKSGQTVLIATSKAAMDPVAFPNPEIIDPHRDFKSYSLLGHGLHFCFGARIVGYSLSATLREVFKLKNIRRAPGKRGVFSYVEHELAGVKMRMYVDQNASESPIPTTLTLEYDE